ncbi:hypothetical protein [Streptomyces sp. NPDC093261]|uniref:hypothetical protein n=1 Tax=Streptomyces sp. NPDC093261 TaxID=3366037 RepID=UPI0038054695
MLPLTKVSVERAHPHLMVLLLPGLFAFLVSLEQAEGAFSRRIAPLDELVGLLGESHQTHQARQ